MQSEPRYERERRQFVRSSVVALVDVTLESGSFFDYTLNMSLGGAYMGRGVNHDLLVNHVHTVRFTLPKLDWVFESQTRVIWLKGELPQDSEATYKNVGFGLEFLDLDQKDTELLRDYLANYQQEQPTNA